MSETKTHSQAALIVGRFVGLAGHLAAILIIFGLFTAPFLSSAVVGMMGVGLQDPQLKGEIFGDVAIMLMLAAASWAVLFFAYVSVRNRLRREKKMVVARVRGTVMTETLIVFPVFLLLTFGLGQMGVNSMAGLLTTLGTWEAARTLAVWGPEVGNNRTGTSVSSTDAKDRARIAAAAVLAPVAPMSAGNIACSKSNSFRKLVQGMVAAGLAPVESSQTYSAFSDALDSATFAQRGPAKFAGAYCSVEVNYTGDMRTNPDETDVGQFKTTVAYKHKMVFPLVGLAFGGTLSPGGWVTTIERNYTLTHHLTPNPELPKNTIF